MVTRRTVLALAVACALGGAAAPSAFAGDGPGNTVAARDIVDANIGEGGTTDIPAPNGEGIANNSDALPTAAFNSVTRNPICHGFTGEAP